MLVLKTPTTRRRLCEEFSPSLPLSLLTRLSSCPSIRELPTTPNINRWSRSCACSLLLTVWDTKLTTRAPPSASATRVTTSLVSPSASPSTSTPSVRTTPRAAKSRKDRSPYVSATPAPKFASPTPRWLTLSPSLCLCNGAGKTFRRDMSSRSKMPQTRSAMEERLLLPRWSRTTPRSTGSLRSSTRPSLLPCLSSLTIPSLTSRNFLLKSLPSKLKLAARAFSCHL
mmetsp:Transcript_27632/g.90004  ORF Transcript_27632/g.90004 Transcript_27632/m.90004 type:complete len:227 (+) Transcript_27632:1610-2290(+)